jgi:DNA primase
MPYIDFAELRRQLQLGQVLALLDYVPATHRGAQVRGPCPLHGSRRPKSHSFAAHLQRHCWQCFRCGAHGNALDLWVAVTQLPVYAAALDLCRRLRLEVPLRTDDRRPASRSPPVP